MCVFLIRELLKEGGCTCSMIWVSAQTKSSFLEQNVSKTKLELAKLTVVGSDWSLCLVL